MSSPESLIAEGVSQVDWGTVLTALLGASGGAFAALNRARGRRRDDMQAFIDQLQEERDQYADLLREERRADQVRMDRMWADKAASREYIAQLRAHIHRGDPPPPPGAPDGYIE